MESAVSALFILKKDFDKKVNIDLKMGQQTG